MECNLIYEKLICTNEYIIMKQYLYLPKLYILMRSQRNNKYFS